MPFENISTTWTFSFWTASWKCKIVFQCKKTIRQNMYNPPTYMPNKLRKNAHYSVPALAHRFPPVLVVPMSSSTLIPHIPDCHCMMLSDCPVENRNFYMFVLNYSMWHDRVDINLGIFLIHEMVVLCPALCHHQNPVTVDLAIVHIIHDLVHCCMWFDLISFKQKNRKNKNEEKTRKQTHKIQFSFNGFSRWANWKIPLQK